MKSFFLVLTAVFYLFLLFFCSGCKSDSDVLAQYPLDSVEGVITRDSVDFDHSVSADGKGSIKITATGQKLVQLFETGDLEIEDCQVIYRAKIKTQNLQGGVYLQMLCSFKDKGEFFSKGLNYLKSGTMDWSSAETPFFLKKGENPDNIKLQIVVEGSGIVWVDDIVLIKAALPILENKAGK